MSKALELLANIEKKQKEELKNIEEQLEKGIEQTSKNIKTALHTRANITENAIQQSDERIAQSIQNNAQTVEKQLSQYQSLLESKLKRLNQINEEIETAENLTKNQKIQQKLSYLNIGLISMAVILIMAIILCSFLLRSKTNEISQLNMTINEKTLRVDHLNRSGGSLNISTCKPTNSKAQRLCIQINEKQGRFGNGYYIPMGY